MKMPQPFGHLGVRLSLALIPLLALALRGQSDASPYQLLKSLKVGGAGGYDYLCADPDTRRLYIPRSNRVTVYDLDSLQSVGEISPTPSVHGVAVDPISHHAFCSSNPVVMWDANTLAQIKTIAVRGSPDGIFFHAASERVLILSHKAPNVTVLDAKSGSVLGTIDLGGAPEQAAADNQGHVFIDIENRDKIAVVDPLALKVLGFYGLGGKGGTPAGLACDAAHGVLFCGCREPATVVILSAADGKIITSLPIGAGIDAAEFDPATAEYFSSQRDGTLTVIKELSPTTFAAEPVVSTQLGARTSTLDPKTHRIFLITADTMPAAGEDGKPGTKRPQQVPGSFTILEVGKKPA